MTKDEMLKIAELVYSHYNERVPSTAVVLKKTMLAWEHALKDIDYNDARKAVSQLVLVEHFQLRPAAVRKQALIIAGNAPQTPTTAQAWALVQRLTNDLNTGAIERTEIHECIRLALAQLGGLPAVAAATNGDRNFFAGVYEPIVRDWETRAYELPATE
jgi:hypothetical protein